MRRELNALRKEMRETNALVRRVVVSLSQLRGDFEEFKPTVATKQDISNLNGRMDGFSGLLLDMRHRWAVHTDTLVQHDERLKKLENKPA